MRGRPLSFIAIYLVISTTSAWSGSSDLDQEIIRIADTVADAYHRSGEGYREIPREVFEQQAKERSAKLQASLPPVPVPVSAPASSGDVSFKVSRYWEFRTLMHWYVPVLSGYLWDNAHNPVGHHSWVGIASTAYLVLLPLAIQLLPLKAASWTIYFPELTWAHLKKWRQRVSSRTRPMQELQRVRVRLAEELEKRDVPVEFAEDVCSPLLDDRRSAER